MTPPSEQNRLEPHPAQQLDRSQPVQFSFDGSPIAGFRGDTIASALAAAGRTVFSRSFKYHRPRGLFCTSGRCPNCLMTVDGTPNVRTCTEPARSGMVVRSQHAWPSLDFDVLAAFDRLAGWLPVGFYYKTFIHPKFAWPWYEHVLRHLAGLGRLDAKLEPQAHGERVNIHADLAVVGAGPAGASAALEAARRGVDVTLIDDQPAPGGHLRWRTLAIDGREGGHRLAEALSRAVSQESRIRWLPGATAFGMYEGGMLGVAQQHKVIHVRARQVIIATGALERPSVFQNNDLPGVFLAEGLQRLAALYGVRPGKRAVVATDDERGLLLAAELLALGIDIAAVADTRAELPESPAFARLSEAAVRVYPAHCILEARGSGRVREAVLAPLDAGQAVVARSSAIPVSCDLIALATGREPLAGLVAQAGRADQRPDWLRAAGEAAGIAGSVADLEAHGVQIGMAAAVALGAAGADRSGAARPAAAARIEPTYPPAVRLARCDAAPGSRKFICLCEDVTDKDLAYAVAEGFDHIETLKRYSTVTMGPCQGKMCHSALVEVCARQTGRTAAETGRTTSRPPEQPIALGQLGGPHHEPVRRTPMHDQHQRAGARWMDLGSWKRPAAYRGVDDECRMVRQGVGIIDVSTLGKLEFHGPGAAPFLDWLHSNRISTLSKGKIRYRLQLDDAGVILDDGTVVRLGDQRFFITTGTGTLDQVEQWSTWWVAAHNRAVDVVDVTAAYAAINVAGPRSRELLSRLTTTDLSNQAVPYLASLEAEVAGVPALFLRIGFLGELGYELHFPAESGPYLWETLLEAGRDLGVAPFGVEAQRVLRLEKLHIIPGLDTDGLTNPLEADLEWAVKKTKPGEDYIGAASVETVRQGGVRQKLVGFEMAQNVVPDDGDQVVTRGQSVGRVTSSRWSATLGKAIGMAWVPVEQAADGGEIRIRHGSQDHSAKVVTRAFYDPEGIRLRS